MASAATGSASGSETLQISDGTTMQITPLPDVDDATWAEVKQLVESNPDTAKNLKNLAKNPEAMRGWLQTQAIAEHYNTRLASGDDSIQDRLKVLATDPELAPLIEDIKKNGLEAAMKHLQDDELMVKFSQKAGGLPQELLPVLKKIQETPLTLHEAAKKGDLKTVQEYLERKKPLDSQDHKGVTSLGYAIGGNHTAVAKLLLESRANAFSVDASGNSSLHYAAGYGRKELVEYLLARGVSLRQANSQGLTPLDVARKNRHAAAVDILQARGAS